MSSRYRLRYLVPPSFSASSAAINFSSSLLCTTLTELFWRRRCGVAATSFSFGSAPRTMPSHCRNSGRVDGEVPHRAAVVVAREA